MKRSHLIILAALILSALALRLWQYHWDNAVVELSGAELTVLVAQTPKQLHRGLGQRENLGSYDGMLFLLPQTHRAGIVMRDMRFPIDIIWLDRGEIVDIAPGVPLEPGVPENALHIYYPRLHANMVLELPAGWTEAHGTKIGDRLTVIKD